MPNLPVLIFAGCYKEAWSYAFDNKLPRNEWRFIRDFQDLQGISQPPNSLKCPLVGTYWQRKDARQLEAVAISRGIVLVNSDAQTS